MKRTHHVPEKNTGSSNGNHDEPYDRNKAHFPGWYRLSVKRVWRHERDVNMYAMQYEASQPWCDDADMIRARGVLQCNPVLMDAERIHERLNDNGIMRRKVRKRG